MYYEKLKLCTAARLAAVYSRLLLAVGIRMLRMMMLWQLIIITISRNFCYTFLQRLGAALAFAFSL